MGKIAGRVDGEQGEAPSRDCRVAAGLTHPSLPRLRWRGTRRVLRGTSGGMGGWGGDEGRVTLFWKGIVLGSSITCAPIKERLRQENPLCLTIPGNQSYAIDRCLHPRRSAFQRLQLQMLAERTAKKGISDDCNLPFQGHSWEGEKRSVVCVMDSHCVLALLLRKKGQVGNPITYGNPALSKGLKEWESLIW